MAIAFASGGDVGDAGTAVAASKNAVENNGLANGEAATMDMITCALGTETACERAYPPSEKHFRAATISMGFIGGSYIVAATPEMYAAAQVALQGCKINPIQCLHNASILVGEALTPGGTGAAGALVIGKTASEVKAVKTAFASKGGVTGVIDDVAATVKGMTLPKGYTPQGTNVVGPKGGVYANTGKVDAAGNPIYTNNGAYYTFENGAKTKVPSPNTGQTTNGRPHHSTSEKDVGAGLSPDYRGQVSYKDGKEVPHGTKGSVRPDFCDGKTCSIEVKNYDINKNINGLINNVSSQAIDRSKHLPLGMEQRVMIDVRGQNLTPLQEFKILQGIRQKSNGIIKQEQIEFLKDKR